MAGNQRLDVKEYIGARYIPIFFDDGSGSAEWQSTFEYEPLTIVLHEGNSYTSRQYVPTGIAITNTAYWLQTGNWNSQIEAYRQEVRQFADAISAAQDTADGAQTAAEGAQSTADGAVTVNNTQNTAINGLRDRVAALESRPIAAEKLSNRKFIFIGDSYQAGATAGGTTTSFLDYIINWGVIQEGQYWRAEVGGAAFAKEGNTFLTLLRSLASQISADEKTAMTDIVVTGCYNEHTSTVAQTVAAMKTFNNYCKANYPNAHITVVPAGWRRYGAGGGAATMSNLYRAVQGWYQGASEIGASFSPGAHSLLARMPFYISSDGIHPTVAGYTALARTVVNALTGGDDTFQIQELININADVSPALTGSTLSGVWYVIPRGNDVQYITSGNFTANFQNMARESRPLIAGRGGFIPIAAAGPWPFCFNGGHYVGSSIRLVITGYPDDAQTSAVFRECSGHWGVNSDGILGIYVVAGFSADGGFGTFRVNNIYSDTASFSSIG